MSDADLLSSEVRDRGDTEDDPEANDPGSESEGAIGDAETVVDDTEQQQADGSVPDVSSPGDSDPGEAVDDPAEGQGGEQGDDSEENGSGGDSEDKEDDGLSLLNQIIFN